MVVIAFAGHGSPIPDVNDDENDDFDECLAPADVCDLAMLDILLAKQREGKLNQTLVAKVNSLKTIADELFAEADLVSPDGADRQEKEAYAQLYFALHTSITDDEFGHWLQRLSGRQIVVILDACHSGGFATMEKGLDTRPTQPATFDFLTGEMARLKDLGQPELALLSACSKRHTALALRMPDDAIDAALQQPDPLSYEFKNPDPLQVMSWFIVKSLEDAPRPLDLEQIYRTCDEEIPAYIDRINEMITKSGKEPVTPYRPQFFNYWTKPVVMKP
jgi:hypothetical protein